MHDKNRETSLDFVSKLDHVPKLIKVNYQIRWVMLERQENVRKIKTF